MSCQGKKGRALERCMKAYQRKSLAMFPTFNKKTDTVSVNARSNNTKGIALSLRNKPKGKANQIAKDSSGSYRNYNLRSKG